MTDRRHEIGSVEEFSDDESRIITEIEGREVAVFRIDGEFYAMANHCPHQSGPLCEGTLRGGIEVGEDGWEWHYDDEKRNITCPWHGWKFDVTTGQNKNDERYLVPTYDVELEDDSVYVLL